MPRLLECPRARLSVRPVGVRIGRRRALGVGKVVGVTMGEGEAVAESGDGAFVGETVDETGDEVGEAEFAGVTG